MVQFVNDKQPVAPVNRVGTPPYNTVDDRRFEQKSSLLPSKGNLANGKAKLLWSRLPIARLTDETGHRGIDQVVRLASASHAQIVEWHSDLHSFVDAICQNAIEFRGDRLSAEQHRRLFEQIKGEVLVDGSLPLPPRSFIDFRFADLDPQAAIEASEQHLEQQCLQLANQFFSLLDRLRDNNVIGLIEVAETSCRFSYNGRIATIEKGPTQIHRKQKIDPEFADHWHKAYFVDTHATTKVTVQHSLSTHIHHVRNPVLRAIDQTKYPIPQRYQDLFDSFPDWIRSSIVVLEGDLFREDGIEWDTRVESHTDTTLVSSEWERCPALVIGDYVLAGWNDQVIAKEEQVRHNAHSLNQRRHADTLAMRYELAAKCAGGLSIAVMALSFLGSGVISLLAVLVGVAAMFFASQSAQLWRSAGSSPSTATLHAAYVGCLVFAVQSLIFGVIQVSLPAIGFAALLGIGARILANFTRLKFIG